MPNIFGPNSSFVENSQDPLQGMDVEVTSVVSSGVAGQSKGPQGHFTSVMFKMVNQTETYLTLNQRTARQLDGEVIYVWAAEQGFISPTLIADTFGVPFATGYSRGRPARVARTVRFNLMFNMYDPLTANNYPGQALTLSADDAATFNNASIPADVQRAELINCRCDTLSFGVTAGRHIVAVSMQGTAEAFKEI